MKSSQILLGTVGLAMLGGAGFMALTNPDEAAFGEFALQQIKAEGCQKVPQIIREQCPQFVQDNQAQVKKLILQSTDRQNFGLFSIYRTNLSTRSIVPNLPIFLDLPAFQLETVGMFGKFYIYQAEQSRTP
ncbi:MULTISPECIES: DUF4359 domain-containing protein [Leptolyngbya]|jgi:hypothetical protein|uniref:DUF4359 domain-containing protein n=2 Tax=Leptolyngbya boryana TaxID=1184 RepID=A0A1Z4JKK2_LEPBY|nr:MULTISPECIES: DUF4359 domain-containing protein [Leptolyngbya]BAY57282.1 hypothetical protein NIES2135_41460 [Leptolyngbya boryana NIES-2135]MBD1857427.1 DUF4359 domain-containing protein [Leptolyngbya sp. FACHB-1624]MBD2366968.1 DUF4359 domain-containing protein [Leptolyngbya sp. FACHB-161]MBD2373678.1 DUF4359 domain-containing protein [Leptolyngbya sp. FACHB-238]MBD2398087.1 DUF4359 domain-containing protein [Leptolyngbya sp. FACHB-239]